MILDQIIRGGEFPKPSQVMDGIEIQQWQQLVHEVLRTACAGLAPFGWCWRRTPAASFRSVETGKFIRCGASPCGAQAVVLAAKVWASSSKAVIT